LAHWRKDWYVRGMYEMAYSARASTIRDAIANQLPLFEAPPFCLLSIRPQHAAAIENGTKRVEFRRKFSRKLKAATALIYVTSPIQQLRLSASILDVVESTPESLWERFGPVAGCDRTDFDQYFSGTDSGFAIALSHVQPLTNPLHAQSADLRSLNFHPPQSFAILDSKSPLVQKVVGVH
jgi:predicted transcriptional regulator